jgi:hypothetical protein
MMTESEVLGFRKKDAETTKRITKMDFILDSQGDRYSIIRPMTKPAVFLSDHEKALAEKDKEIEGLKELFRISEVKTGLLKGFEETIEKQDKQIAKLDTDIKTILAKKYQIELEKGGILQQKEERDVTIARQDRQITELQRQVKELEPAFILQKLREGKGTK